MLEQRETYFRWLMTAAYLATPFFAVLDYGFGQNIRVAFLEEEPGWRAAYYATIMTLGIVMVWVPVVARPLGIVEAGINVGLTCVAMFLPYVRMIESVQTGEELAMPELPIPALTVGFVILAIGSLGSLFRLRSSEKPERFT